MDIKGVALCTVFLGNLEVNSLCFGIFASILAFASGNIIIYLHCLSLFDHTSFSLTICNKLQDKSQHNKFDENGN